jgi:hypothetical protein
VKREEARRVVVAILQRAGHPAVYLAAPLKREPLVSGGADQVVSEGERSVPCRVDELAE